MLTPFLFPVIAFGILFFALAVILARTVIYSVLSLVCVLGLTAVLFVLLKAYLVAAILILVYAGAILVLFLFVVMMTEFGKKPAPFSAVLKDPRGLVHPAVAVILSAGLFWEVRSVIVRTCSVLPAAQPAAEGSAADLARILFGAYLLPFELTALLLFSALISVVVLAGQGAKK